VPTPALTLPIEPPAGRAVPIADALAELNRLLPRLAEALERSAAPRLALRLDELAQSLGVSPRLLQAEVSAGRFPRPRKIGRASVFPVEVLREFLSQQAPGRGG
jgi:predicted DNA-binding transcriptional regulator AlpA